MPRERRITARQRPDRVERSRCLSHRLRFERAADGLDKGERHVPEYHSDALGCRAAYQLNCSRLRVRSETDSGLYKKNRLVRGGDSLHRV